MKTLGELPFPRHAAPATTPVQRGFAPAAPTPQAVEPLRVLVVDDNVDAAETLQMLLQIAGHQPRCAFDGLTALSAAREFRPQVALLDLGLPGLDGYQLAQTLRGEAWAAGLRLIAVSGWSSDTDRARSQEAGFHHHLAKPVDPAELLALIAPTAS